MTSADFDRVCASCGEPVGDAADGDQRSACGHCGSLDRKYKLTVSEVVHTTDGVLSSRPEPSVIEPELAKSLATAFDPIVVSGSDVLRIQVELQVSAKPTGDNAAVWILYLDGEHPEVPIGVGEIDDSAIAVAEWIVERSKEWLNRGP